MYGCRLFWFSVLNTVFVLFPILSAFFVKHFVDALANGERPLGILLLIVALLLSSWLGRHLAFFYLFEAAIALRKGLTGLLFAKSLRLSMAALAEATPGRLINICSGDMALIESNIGQLPPVLGGPASALLVLCLLFHTVGVAAFYSLAVASFLLLLQFPVSAFILQLRLRISAASDTRLSLIQTLILGMQTVKSYGWEAALVARSKAARSEEISRLRRFFSVNGFFQGFMLYSEALLALPILLVPVLAGVPLDATSALVGLSLAGFLSISGVFNTNLGLTAAANYLSVLRRVQEVLLLPEQRDQLPPPLEEDHTL